MLRKLEHLRIVTGFCGDTFSPYSNPPSLPRGLASRPPGGAQMSSEGHKQAARMVPGGYQGPPWVDCYQGQACEGVLSHLFHGPPLSSFPLGQPACQTVCRKADKRTTRQSFCYSISCGHGLKIACHRQPTPHSRRRACLLHKSKAVRQVASVTKLWLQAGATPSAAHQLTFHLVLARLQDYHSGANSGPCTLCLTAATAKEMGPRPQVRASRRIQPDQQDPPGRL